MNSQILISQLSQTGKKEEEIITRECKRIRNMVWVANRKTEKRLEQTSYKAKQKWAKERLKESRKDQLIESPTITKTERKGCVKEHRNGKEETRWKHYQEEAKKRGARTAAKEAAWDAKID